MMSTRYRWNKILAVSAALLVVFLCKNLLAGQEVTDKLSKPEAIKKSVGSIMGQVGIQDKSVITVCKYPYFQKSTGPSKKVALPPCLSNVLVPYAWKMLVIVYPRIDASYIWKGKTNYLQHEMNDTDRSFFLQTINRIPDTVYVWADGNTQIKLTVVISDRPIQSVTVTNEGTDDENANWWVAPDDVRPEIDTYAPPGTYDSIITVFSLVEGSIWGVATVGIWGECSKWGRIRNGSVSH